MPGEETNNDEYSSTNTHTRFNDDNDECDNERTDNSYSGTIISPKDYNSIKQCTDLSRRNILNPAIGAPVWMAVRKYIFMQWILFKVNDINVKHARDTTQRSIYKSYVIVVDSPASTATHSQPGKHGKSPRPFSTGSFQTDL